MRYQEKEYVLRNPQRDGAWEAFDEKKTLVVIYEHACTPIEPIVQKRHTIQEPIYFRQSKEEKGMIPMVSSKMKKDIDCGKTCGYFEDDRGRAWSWDTKKMTFCSDYTEHDMRVITTGGWCF